MFNDNSRTLYALELKSTQGSLTFWRKDFEEKNGKKKSYNIKRNQIQGLQKWSNHLMNCGFVFNFRQHSNRTFFVMIDEFLDYTRDLDKKSINMDDVLQMNPIEIENKVMKTHYKYNLEKFFKETVI